MIFCAVFFVDFSQLIKLLGKVSTQGMHYNIFVIINIEGVVFGILLLCKRVQDCDYIINILL